MIPLVTVMDIGIFTHLSPLTSVYTLFNLPLCLGLPKFGSIRFFKDFLEPRTGL